MKLIAVIFPRTRPSHIARMDSLAENSSLEVHGIEVLSSASDLGSAWNLPCNERKWFGHTLFNGRNCNKKTGKVILESIISFFDKLAPDVIAIAGWYDPAMLSSIYWARKNGIKIILMSETSSFSTTSAYVKNFVKYKIINNFDSALVAGTPQKQYLIDMGMSVNRIYKGYTVVDNKHFFNVGTGLSFDKKKIYERAASRKYFLTVSRLVEEKNLFRLIYAYKKYRAKFKLASWDLVIVGQGPLYSCLLSYIKDNSLSDSVKIMGFKSYQELPEIYGSAQVYIQSSVHEAWGMSINEAMASGLPIICSEMCGCSYDLIKNGVNGYLFNPYNVEELVYKMGLMHIERKNTLSMGNASLDIIKSYTAESFSRGIVDAFQDAEMVTMKKMKIYERLLLIFLIYRSRLC
jgi:1,2-diacylglycerol 3-alpha-glucosyltransferase